MGISYSPRIVTDGLVLCLDAANPRSYPGTGTTWTDRSTSGNNGTLTNGPTFDSGDGGSIVLDGSDDLVSVTITKSADCTFSTWAARSNTSADMLFNAGANNSGPDLFFYQSKISWNTWNGANNPFADIPSNASDGNFHQYVLVNDSSSTAKLYYDGELLGTATYRDASATTLLNIGQSGFGQYLWQGNIANFMLHNKLLSEDEVRQNYLATKGRYK